MRVASGCGGGSDCAEIAREHRIGMRFGHVDEGKLCDGNSKWAFLGDRHRQVNEFRVRLLPHPGSGVRVVRRRVGVGSTRSSFKALAAKAAQVVGQVMA